MAMDMSRNQEDGDTCPSEKFQKQIDELPKHAEDIYKEAIRVRLKSIKILIKERILMKV